MLELDGISKSYAKVRALEPLSLNVEAGRCTVLIGPSGCGKSTLIRVMVGLISPDKGCVRFEGTVLTEGNVRELRHAMGYVIQDGGLFPHLTAERNVTLMARYLGWADTRIGERLQTLAELTRFPIDGLSRYPLQLSGGQRQRVALMRALMLDPDVLFLDEPLGALDPMIRSDLQADLKDVFTRLGKTVVLVTHDLSEAAFLGDDIILMRRGAIVQRGTFDELLHRPVDPFVTRFVNAQRGPLQSSEGQA